MVDRDTYNIVKQFALFNSEISNNWYSDMKNTKESLFYGIIKDMDYGSYEEVHIKPCYYYDILDWLVDNIEKYEIMVAPLKDDDSIGIKKVKFND